MLAKTLEGGVSLPDLIKAMLSYYRILKPYNLEAWKTMLGQDIYRKVLAGLSIILESIEARDLVKVYI